jgi:hypothetical protein
VSQNHLTDTQLQDYLDDNISKADPIAVHLNSCRHCQQALAVYKNLYTAIEKDPGFDLSPAFAEAVINRLPNIQPVAESTDSARFHVKDSIVLFIAVAAAIAAAIYFINPEVLIKQLTGWMELPTLPENQILNEANGYFSQLNLGATTIIFAVLTFAGIGIIDRIIAHRRHQQKPVSFLV